MSSKKNSDIHKYIGQYQANERTFLAWVRTGIALMGFGFVIVKFSLFLKQMTLMIGSAKESKFSGLAGVLMVAAGIILTLFAYIQYKRVERQIDDQNYTKSSFLTLFITLIMIIGGAGLIIYLLPSL